MLRDLDFNKYTHVWILPNYTDMRQGIDKLAAIIQYQLHLDAYDEHALFLFCGKRRSRLKALAFEGDGFTLVYHRISENGGRFYWPMSEDDVLRMTPEQYRRLLNGFTMDPGVSIRKRRAPG